MRAKILFTCGCSLGLKRVYHCPKHGNPIDLETIRARKKPERKVKKIKGVRQITEKRLDRLFSLCVRSRAGYRDEVNDEAQNPSSLYCHHIVTRSCRRLRWDFQNGVSVSFATHRYKFHGTSKARETAEEVIYSKRPGCREYLSFQKNIHSKPDLMAIEIMLRLEAQRLGLQIFDTVK